MRGNRDWGFRHKAIRGTQLHSWFLVELADCRGCHSDVSISTFKLAKATSGGCVPWSNNCDPTCSSLYYTDLLPKDRSDVVLCWTIWQSSPLSCLPGCGGTNLLLSSSLLAFHPLPPEDGTQGFLNFIGKPFPTATPSINPWLGLCVHSLLSANAVFVFPLFRSYFK